MNSLVVVSHADPDSLTQHIARETVDGLRSAGGTVEFADLAAEGFDPRFSRSDLQSYRSTASTSEAIVAEQDRIDRADQLILVFPVYWWSAPALLKGWIDRVFINGWAFDDTQGTGIVRKLGRLTVHLIPVAGDDASGFRRHGYDAALRTQLEHGVIEYCGATVGSTTFVHESETQSRGDIDAQVRKVVDEAVSRIAGSVPIASVTAQPA